jgi:hypothetical protein
MLNCRSSDRRHYPLNPNSPPNHVPSARTLPSVKQPHTIDKPGKDDTNPQTEGMKKAREEKKSTDQQPKGGKPKKGPNAGIGLQVSISSCHY